LGKIEGRQINTTVVLNYVIKGGASSGGIQNFETLRETGEKRQNRLFFRFSPVTSVV